MGTRVASTTGRHYYIVSYSSGGAADDVTELELLDGRLLLSMTSIMAEAFCFDPMQVWCSRTNVIARRGFAVSTSWTCSTDSTGRRPLF